MCGESGVGSAYWCYINSILLSGNQVGVFEGREVLKTALVQSLHTACSLWWIIFHMLLHSRFASPTEHCLLIYINLQTHTEYIHPAAHTAESSYPAAREDGVICRCFPYRSSLNRAPCVVPSTLQPLRLPPKAIWWREVSVCVYVCVERFGGGAVRKSMSSSQDWDKMDEVTSSWRKTPGSNHSGFLSFNACMTLPRFF